MCGIIGTTCRQAQEDSLHTGLQSMLHRGPDFQAIWNDDYVRLGHARLSIIDPDARSNQPMEIDGVSIVFNGEIYNFRELASEHHLITTTSSDTEVLLRLYLKLGIHCLPFLNGMFAFAIYDSRVRKIFLARDRFGKKPLYYNFNENGLSFSSTIYALRKITAQPAPLDKRRVLEYFSFLTPVDPGSIYEGMSKLPAGCVLTYDFASVTVNPYYRLVDAMQPLVSAVESRDLEHEIEDLLLDSVRLRLISDVPVASFLSGGIDSSLISALYAEVAGNNFHTFSIGYDQYEEYCELKYARISAEHIGSIHHELRIGKSDFLEAFDDVIAHMDEPINDPACFPTYLLSKHVHETGIKTILSGEGSDEIFLGYDRYWEFLSYVHRQSGLDRSEKSRLLKQQHMNQSLERSWEYERRVLADEIVYRTIGESFNEGQLRLLFDQDKFEPYFSQCTGVIIDKYRQGSSSAFGQDPTRWFSCIDLDIWMQNVLLAKIDRMTMAWSLEARAPFLDFRLVERLLNIDQQQRMGSTNKALLKNIAGRYLPDEIIHRRKKGFSSPHFEWYCEEYGSSMLNDWREVNAELGFFRDSFLVFLHEQAMRGRFKQHVWGLIVFCRWYRIHM